MSLSHYNTVEDAPHTGIPSSLSSKGTPSLLSKSVTETAIPIPWESTSSRVHSYSNDVTQTVSVATGFSAAEQLLDGDDSIALVSSPTTKSSIYFKDEFISPELRRGVRLLDQGQHCVFEALESLRRGDIKDSDERIMDFKEILPELFCLRTVSHGFGAIVNAIQNAFANRLGAALDEDELLAIEVILASLLREPAMSTERAVEHIMTFEDAGFVVESQVLGGFLDLVELIGKDVDPVNA